MQNHMHLARIPQGPERDYVRGVLRFMYRDGLGFKKFMYWVSWLIVIGLVRACIIGANRIYIGELETVGILGIIFLIALAILFAWMLIKVGQSYIKEKEIEAFENIQVWDVQATDILRTMGRGPMRYFTKPMFADGTVDMSQYELWLYSSQIYTYGLLVAAYNDRGERVLIRLIPRMEYGTKAYKLALKGL